jgi:hypothetical protein
MDKRRSNKRRIKHSLNNPQTSKNDVKEGYWSFFGEEAPPGAQEEWERQKKAKREEAAKRRVEGYEWFFK